MNDQTLGARLRETRDVLTTALSAPPHDAFDLGVIGLEPVRPRGHSSRIVVAGAVVAAAACVAVVAAIATTVTIGARSNPGAPHGSGPNSATSFSGSAGRGVARYVYTRAVTELPGGHQDIEETWIPMQSGDHWLTRDTNMGVVHDQSGTCANVRPVDACDGPGNWKDASLAFVARLPRAADRLAAALRAIADAAVSDPANSRSEQPDQHPSGLEAKSLELVLIQNVLESGYSDPTLSRAFQHVLATMSGVTVVPDARNLAGETGTAYGVAIPDGNGTHATPVAAIVFNAHGVYIGERRTQTAQVPDGSVFSTGTAAAAGAAPLTLDH